MEFGEIGTQVNTVSLLNGQEVVENVPIVAAPSTAEGSIPARSANASPVFAQTPVAPPVQTQVQQQVAQQQQAAPQQAKPNPIDQANGAVDKASSAVDKVNGAKASGQDLANRLKRFGIK
jgi:hypothetical protein